MEQACHIGLLCFVVLCFTWTKLFRVIVLIWKRERHFCLLCHISIYKTFPHILELHTCGPPRRRAIVRSIATASHGRFVAGTQTLKVRYLC